MRLAVIVALAASLNAPAMGWDCPLWMLRTRAHFYPVTHGPQTTFERLKAELNGLLQGESLFVGLTAPESRATFLKTAVHFNAVSLLKHVEAHRAVKVWARLVNSYGVGRRTGIVGGLEEGSRSPRLRWWLASGLVDREVYAEGLRRLALAELANIHTWEARREIAWAITASAQKEWTDAIAQYLAGDGEALARARAEIAHAHRIADGERGALYATKGPNAPQTMAAAMVAENLRRSVQFFDRQLLRADDDR